MMKAMTLISSIQYYPDWTLGGRRRDRITILNGPTAASSLSRRLCVVAVTMSFAIGMVVGILLPIYVPASSPSVSLLPYHRTSPPPTPYVASLSNRPDDAHADDAVRPWSSGNFSWLSAAGNSMGNASGSDVKEGEGGGGGGGKNRYHNDGGALAAGIANDPNPQRAGTPHSALSWPVAKSLPPSLTAASTPSWKQDSGADISVPREPVGEKQSEPSKTDQEFPSNSHPAVAVASRTASLHPIQSPGDFNVLLHSASSLDDVIRQQNALTYFPMKHKIFASGRSNVIESKTIVRANRSHSVEYHFPRGPLVANGARTYSRKVEEEMDLQNARGSALHQITPFSTKAGVPQIVLRPLSLSSSTTIRSKTWPIRNRLNGMAEEGARVAKNLERPPAMDQSRGFTREFERPAANVHSSFTGPTVENTTAAPWSATDVLSGIYWNDRVEAMLPKGFSTSEITAWTHFAGNTTVVKVVEGCGRMQNRLLVFENGIKSCCRYRQNNDQIQGEIFSFYLSRLLGLHSLPPATLGLLHGREWQWRPVRGQLTLAQWNEQKPMVMAKFVDDLVPAYIPRHFRGEGRPEQRRLHPVSEDLEDLSVDELRELAQWSDLIVFDYLTANLDRVVNNMYNKQWNPDMMAAPAHNLAKVSSTGLLVFLDNESGLLHGYRLLDKYESYHKAMLQALCVFRRSTAQAVQRLHQSGNVGAQLKAAFLESQPYMAEWLPMLPDKSVKILRDRLSRVNQQINYCEQKYLPNFSSTEGLDDLSQVPDYPDSLTKTSVTA